MCLFIAIFNKWCWKTWLLKMKMNFWDIDFPVNYLRINRKEKILQLFTIVYYYKIFDKVR